MSSSLTGPTLFEILAERIQAEFPGRTVVTSSDCHYPTITVEFRIDSGIRSITHAYDLNFKGSLIRLWYTYTSFGMTDGTKTLKEWDQSDPGVDPDDILECFMQVANGRLLLIM